MKITLQVDGRELSLEEVEAIVREHFLKKEVTKQKATTKKEAKPMQKPTRPTEGVPFEVNPSGIDRSLFQKEREDKWQEIIRQHILEAFAKMDENPGKYGKPFKTLILAKTWEWKTVGELRKLATKLGDHMANWVEQFLEWAQRIQNGETWEAICNEADTANWFRLLEWKDGYARLVGGSREGDNSNPASYVNFSIYYSSNIVFHAVPLVVLYK